MKARIPGGRGGGAQSNISAMLRQAQTLQEDMAALQAELDEREYAVTAGGGAVTEDKRSGKYSSIDIQPEIVDPDDIETLMTYLPPR